MHRADVQAPHELGGTLDAGRFRTAATGRAPRFAGDLPAGAGEQVTVIGDPKPGSR